MTETPEWVAPLQAIGDDLGFFERIGDKHCGLYIEAGDTLIVTFENLDHVDEQDGARLPWGYKFIESHGWSMLGMMAQGWTWYRDEDVFDFFDRLRDEGFFNKFKRVVFYGASMGGYAASVFSAAAPDATLILISPQATLDKKLVPFENRYKVANKLDFSGRYSYGPELSKAAKKVNLFIDPFHNIDPKHAALFDGDNVEVFNSHFCGHRQASLWMQFGILKQVITGAIEGTLTQKDFYKLLRARRDNLRFRKEMVERLLKKERYGLLSSYLDALESRMGGSKPFTRQARKAIRHSGYQK